MSLATRAYLLVILISGFATFVLDLRWFNPADPYRFAAYLTFAMISSAMKVALPGVTGTLSVLFLFMLIGILDLSLAETLLVGAAAVFVQSYWRPKKKPRLIHVAFNIASLVIAIKSSHLVYTFLIEMAVPFPAALAATAFTFFVGNTLTVAVVIALTETKSVIETWRSCYFWSFPYYIVGACLAGLFSSLTAALGWQTSVLFLPVMYLIYRSYRLYLDRLEQGRHHAEELQIAANRLTAVLESTTDLVLATDHDARITYANQRARQRLFGDLEPKGAVFWDVFPKLGGGLFQERMRDAIRRKVPLGIEEEFFPELNAWFDVHAYPSAEGIALYLKDVTAERELGEQLRQAQKMEAIGRLAGGVAHDFNNLLTIILGYGQVVADILDKDHPCHGAVTEVLKAGDRAAGLTQRLLAFSRKQILKPVVLDLNSIVSGIEGMLRRLIGEDVRILVTLDSSLYRVEADPNQIDQVVMNLAVNARDAMPAGGELRIETYNKTVEASVAKQYGVESGLFAVLSVTDTGTGMDATIQAKIFEPFFTTKELGKGTGLGLSTVYGIVKQSGGYVTLHSEVGRGTTFNVHLPAAASADISPSAQAADTVQVDPVSGKILLVEDEEAVRELTHRMLTDVGYEVVDYESGAQALLVSSEELKTFDLLLTDVVMPGVSGAELAVNLTGRRPKLKVLYISGYTEHPLLGKTEFSGETLLNKPYTRTQLLSKVHAVLTGPLHPA
jgi:signal transduction histidine kinase/CheY-like chemotaxis protein